MLLAYGGIVNLVVTAFHGPLVVMNVLLVDITSPSVVTRTKYMNLTVISTDDIDQRVFPVVISVRADRVDQAVLSLS